MATLAAGAAGPLLVLVYRFLRGIYRRGRRARALRRLTSKGLGLRTLAPLAVAGVTVAGTVPRPPAADYDAVGLAFGALVGRIAVRTSTSRQEGERWLYRPHPLLKP